MAKRSMLICYAHPDDESFGLGGLIARYVDEGVEVYLICATDGAAGSMDEQYLENGRTIRDVRLSELDCAAETLGLKDVFMLGYRDSGMMGSAENDHPDCLWNRWQQHPAEVTRRVTEVIRKVRPQVVITFNEYGGYGHPDHIAIQQATVAAMEVANDPEYPVDASLPPYQPQKLYYSGIPKFPVQLGVFLSRLQGKNPRALGRNQDIDIVAILDHVEPPTTLVNIRRYYGQWNTASDCHASQQTEGGFFNLPTWVRRRLFPNQGFRRVYPAGTPGDVDEYDLFANIQTDTAEAMTSS